MLVSPTVWTVQTGQASAENTHNQECTHDVIGLYAHNNIRALCGIQMIVCPRRTSSRCMGERC